MLEIIIYKKSYSVEHYVELMSMCVITSLYSSLAAYINKRYDWPLLLAWWGNVIVRE